MSNAPVSEMDWSIATFDGARREQLRRWADLPLIDILTALEEMEMLAVKLGGTQSTPSRPQEADTSTSGS